MKTENDEKAGRAVEAEAGGSASGDGITGMDGVDAIGTGTGHGESSIDDGEVETIGDLGNEFDDPDGWMSERAHYWTDLAKAAHPTRTAMLRHQIVERFELLRDLAFGKSLDWPTDRIPESEWRRLADETFGYVEKQFSKNAAGSFANGLDASLGSRSESRVVRSTAWLLGRRQSTEQPSDEPPRAAADWPPRPSRVPSSAPFSLRRDKPA